MKRKNDNVRVFFINYLFFRTLVSHPLISDNNRTLFHSVCENIVCIVYIVVYENSLILIRRGEFDMVEIYATNKACVTIENYIFQVIGFWHSKH